jgi:FkbM family methyltransferase
MKQTFIKCLKYLGLFRIIKILKRKIFYLSATGKAVQKEASEIALKANAFYSQFIEPGDICFDIGANIGDRTGYFLALGARVISVEPQTACVDELNFRYGKNKNVEIIKKALGAEKGMHTFYQCKESPNLSSLSEEWINKGRFANRYKWNKRLNIPVTTLDDLISIYGCPTFCKIDVEGFEVEVFKGLSKKIACISFEFHKETLDNALKCMDILEKMGDVTFNYSKGESFELSFSEWISSKEIIKILNEDSDENSWGDIYARFNK